MSWLHQLQSESAIRLARTGLPRRVLRHLIFAHETGVGSRILEVGCGTGELVSFFDQLGFVAVGIDESSENLEQAGQTAPSADFFCGCVDETLAIPTDSCDLVIVRARSPFSGNLFDRKALRTTANLLTMLRPQGHLVFVVEPPPIIESLKSPGHTGDCYMRHLAAFPGLRTFAEFPEQGLSGERLKRMMGQPSHSGVLTATLQLSIEKRPRDEWLEIADLHANSKSVTCCDESQAAAANSLKNHRAA